jgi:hypothetical protein
MGVLVNTGDTSLNATGVLNIVGVLVGCGCEHRGHRVSVVLTPTPIYSVLAP